ncbi:MAG TPA: hypothetical protein VE685_18110 [Thermoanaerobaculia bacterium]|nr:hypothetical protein [Thermoanaerobaculia bacterium]
MKSSPLLRFLSILVLLLGACSQAPSGSSSSPSSIPPPPRSEAEPDILEAAFRYQFEHNESAIRENAQRYCLTLTGGKEPSAEFLRRFEGHEPPVVASDRCDRTSAKYLFIQAGIVPWENDSTAIVRGGYYEGRLSSSKEELRVVWKDGEWVVQDKRLEVIS